jgi:hypothetical protein
MSKSLVSAMMFLSASMGFASDLNLSPGSTATIHAGDTTTVSCEMGTVTGLPACTLQMNAGGDYMVKAGDGLIPVYSGSIDDALAVVKKLKNAGICL